MSSKPGKEVNRMSLSVFDDKTVLPDNEMLTQVLADSRSLWDDAIQYVGSLGSAMNGQWKYYSKKAGWSHVVKSSERTILYLIPQDAFFKASFVLGEKAVDLALGGDLPEDIKELIRQAAPYVEGRSFMFDIRTKTDLEAAKKLIDIKNSG